jgi:hypothetical protein
MTTCACNHRDHHTLPRRAIAFAQWLTPAATLALIPKCPMCLAAYLALATGLSIPIPTATYLRLALITASLAALTYLTWRTLRPPITKWGHYSFSKIRKWGHY